MKSNRRLRLLDQARADVREILRFTARHWGSRQRARYSAQLHQAMNSLLDYPERGRTRDEYFPGCRGLPVEQHVVFYHLTDDEVIVVRVLHGNQDAAGKVNP
jgi:toxin ParE1/3/4